jgi:ABC-2 type transport system ATP-binding protein
VLSEVSQTVDEVAVIHRGRLRAHATLAELTGERAGVRTVRVRSPQADRLAELLGPAATTVEQGLIKVVDSTPESVGDLAAANGITLHELVAEGVHQSLEEVFLELTRDAEAEDS